MISRLFLATALLFQSSFANAALVDRLEASVNSRIILHSDVERFRKTSSLRTQLDPLFRDSKLSETGGQATNRQIVDFLIDEMVVLEEFEVSDDEVEQRVKSIQAENQIDRSQLISALSAEGFSFDQYFTIIRSSLAKMKLIDRDIRTKVYISDADVKNYYYNLNPNKGALEYRIQLIQISPENYRSSSVALETVQRVHRELEGGEPFDEVAKRVSDGPTADAGGDLGFLPRDEMASTIREEVEKLKVGEFSAPFGNSKAAYFIAKLADIRSGDERRLKQQTNQIREMLAAKEYRRQIELWLDRERQKAFIHYAGKPLFD
jgi:peptidyl-prolyl cis-trans isomerase SurA